MKKKLELSPPHFSKMAPHVRRLRQNRCLNLLTAMNRKITLPAPSPVSVPTHVVFRLDGTLYGLPLSQVAGVSLTDQAPAYFSNFQSVDRFDLRSLLRLPGRSTGKETGLILLSSYNLAFQVDSIEDILPLDARFPGRRGAASSGHEEVTFLDIHELLHPQEVEFA